jgi:hypothetical protein
MPLVSLRDNDYTLDVADFEETYPRYQPTNTQPSSLTQNALLPTNIDSTAAVEDVSVVTCDTLLKNSQLSGNSGNSSSHEARRGSCHHSTEVNQKNNLKLSTMTYSEKGVAASTYYSRQWSLTSNQSQDIRQNFFEHYNSNNNSNSSNIQNANASNIHSDWSRGESSENTCSRSNSKEQERQNDVGRKTGDHQNDCDNDTLHQFTCRHDSSTTATTTSLSTLPVNNNSTNLSSNDLRRNSLAQDQSPQKPLAVDGMRRNASFATTGGIEFTPQTNNNPKNLGRKKGSKIDLSNLFNSNNNTYNHTNDNDDVSAISKVNGPFSKESKQKMIHQANNTNDDKNQNSHTNEYVRQLEEKLTKLSLDLATCQSQLDIQRLQHHQELINSEETLKEKDRTIQNLQEKLYMMQQMHQTRSSAVTDPYHKAAQFKAAAAQQRTQNRSQHTSSNFMNSFDTFSSNSCGSNLSYDLNDSGSGHDGRFAFRKSKGKQEESRRASWISVRLGSIQFNDSSKIGESDNKESIQTNKFDNKDTDNYENDDYDDDDDDPFATYCENRRAVSSMTPSDDMTDDYMKKQPNWLERSLPWGNNNRKHSKRS